MNQTKPRYLTLILAVACILLSSGLIVAQDFTIVQNLTGANRADLRGQAFIPVQQGTGTGSITAATTVYLKSFSVVYDAGTEAPTMYIYSALPSSTASLDDGTGGLLVGQSSGKSSDFPYTVYSFPNLPLNKNTTYYAVFRQNVHLEYGASGSSAGPYPGGKMLVNNGTNTVANDFTALKFSATLTNVTAPHAGDVAALTALYNATNGANWTTKWNLAADPFTWYGVSWQGNRVVRIDINSNNLEGQIPTQIGNLSELTFLWLLGNKLSGPVPESLANLTKVTYINFNFNQLSGPFPEFFGTMTNLENLAMSGNNFTGSLPSSITTLPKLKSLLIEDNDMSGAIPAALGNASTLEHLYLGGNEFTSVPAELGNLSALKGLSIADIPFDGTMPAWIFQLTNLESLRIAGCSFDGPIPASIGNLSKLTYLDGSSNEFTAFPAEFFNITTFTQLSLNNNQFAGSIPVQFQNLTELRILNLGYNPLTGPIPAALGNLPKIQTLHIFNTNISGTIPTQLGNLTTLTQLTLSANKLEGSIPASLGNLTLLTDLNLANNKLSGAIPAELGNLTQMRSLDLSDNQLSGVIPAALENMTILNTLYLRNNKFNFVSFEPRMTYINSRAVKVIAPQLPIEVANDTLFITFGNSFQLEAVTPGTNNQYEWFRSNLSLGAPSPSATMLTVNNFQTVNAGNYECRVTNALVPGLTLSTQIVVVTYLPAFTANFPTVSDITTKSAKLSASTNKFAQIFYVLTAQGSPTPTIEQIIAGKDATGQPALKSGVLFTTEAISSIGILGLTYNTSYTVHTALRDTHKATLLGPSIPFKTLEGITFSAGYPKVSGVQAFQFTLAVRTSINGTCYYVLLPAGSAAPTATQIMAQQNAAGGSATGGNLAVGSTGETLVGITNLTEQTGYDIYVVAKDADDIVTPVVKINAITITGLEFGPGKLNVFPNPASGRIVVEYPVNGRAEVQIIDLNGRKHYQGSINSSSDIDVSGFAAGVYVLQITSTAGTNRVLVVKQ